MLEFGLILDKEKTTEQIFKICQYYDVKNVDLAELMYSTEVEISNWKTGKRFPSWDKILLFAYVFKISLDDLIIRKKSKENKILETIQKKILMKNQQNLIKTLEKKTSNNENINPICYQNVRWNPLIQDWVPLDRFDKSIEEALRNNEGK